MRVKDITEIIEWEIPLDKALEWDNPGLLVGDEDAQVERVYLALDATDGVIARAKDAGAQLILTHHPLIFSGIKNVTESTFTGRRIRELIRSGISCYAMHTNFDVCVMGKLAAGKLGLQQPRVLEPCGADGDSGIGSVGMLPEEMSLEKLAKATAEAFGISHVKVFGDAGAKVKRAAICPGSGRSTLKYALAQQADVYITGDIDHHTGIDAVAAGMAVIDAGHYGIEHIYTAYMKAFLEKRIPKLKVTEEPFGEPFWIGGV